MIKRFGGGEAAEECNRQRDRDAGITLIEVMITIGLFTVVLGSLYSVFDSVQQSEAIVQDRVQVYDDMRVVFSRMSKEIRQASSLSSSSTDTLLTVDTYFDGVPRVVTYSTSGGLLTRQAEGSSVEILANLHNDSIFSYDPEPSAVAPIVLVEDADTVLVTLQVRPPRRPDTIVELQAEVKMRNTEEES